jgi:DNA-directed RNA polymerase subunit RPC12/RpoP
MNTIHQCPSCGTQLKFDGSVDRAVKCPKCGFKGRTADFKEVVVKTLYCPECNHPQTIPADKLTRTLTCPKCKRVEATTKYLDSPRAPEVEENVLTDTNLGGEIGKVYRPGSLHLVGGEGGWTGDRDIALVRGKNTLGRRSPNSSSSIQLPTADAFMSKNHAVVEVVMMPDAQFEHRVWDNGSVNGTFHNEQRLDPDEVAVLSPGDTLRLGRTTLKFIVEQ